VNVECQATPSATRDQSLLISLILVGADGFGSCENKIERIAASLRERYAFFEILLIAPAGNDAHSTLVERIGRIAPQLRLLQVEGATDFDRLATLGYQECIGDLILVSSADEIGFVDFISLIERLGSGEQLVRLRRKSGSTMERLSSRLVRLITGLHVDTRFYRTLALTRQLLSELLARPDEIHLFRFTAHTHFGPQIVIKTNLPQTRRGFPLFLRRVDLLAQLTAESAPRLLRFASAMCLALALVALLALSYIALVWVLRSTIAEGWTTTITLLSVWMLVQMSATSVLCLGLSRALDRQERGRMVRLVEETTVSDLFGSVRVLNVESADAPNEERACRPSPASASAG
jgi:hypothetical protein